jgi:hypothetical protein
MTILDDVRTQEIAEFIDVTPQIAQQWLGLNTSNRKLKKGNVATFANDMAAGRWKVNGEAVKLAGAPLAPTKLLDGQNRLHAVIRAGVTVRLLVVFGVDEDAQRTMDSGAKRTVADNVQMLGTKNAHVVASAASLALRIDDGLYGSASGNLSNARVLDFIEDNPDLIRSAGVAVTYATRSEVPKSVVAYTHWRFSRLDLGEATGFWRDTAEKIGLESGDPVLALASRFQTARRNRERYAQPAAVAAVFRTWNARRAGQSMRSVAITAVGAGGLPRIK